MSGSAWKEDADLEVSLGARMLRGSFWVFTLRVVQRLLGLGRLVLLARLLAPEDFGQMGAALLVLSLTETFSRTGLEAALIQRKGPIAKYLDAAWTVHVLRGMLLCAVLWGLADWASGLLNVPDSASLIRAVAFTFLLQAMSSAQMVYLRKELAFERQFKIQFSGALAETIVAISAAIILRSVWALALGALASALVACIASYFVCPHRPRLDFQWEKLKDLWGFGIWVSASAVLAFILTQSDDTFVAHLLGGVALGYYQMAYKISSIPATEFSHLVSAVLFPAYAEIQEDKEQLRKVYLRVLQITAICTFPLAALILTLSNRFVPLLLGEHWLQVIPYVQILAFFGLFRALGQSTMPLLMGVGRPDLRIKIQSVQALALLPMVWAGITYGGLIGAAIAVTINAFLFNIVVFYQALTVAGVHVRDGLAALTGPMLGAIALCAACLSLGLALPEMNPYLSLGLLLFSATATYCLLLYALDGLLNTGLRTMVKTLLAKLTP